MRWDEVVEIGLGFPGVEVGVSYGTPALRVKTKFLTRLRFEDDSLVFTGVGFDERDFLLEADPAVFHITPHYKDYPSILVRLAAADRATVLSFIERSWRRTAPKRLIAAYDRERDGPSASQD